MAPASLLNALASPKPPEPSELLAALQAALPPAHMALLDLVVEEAIGQSMPIYVVGGVLRDLLLQRPVKDADLVVEGEALRLGRGLVKRFGGRLVTHPRFGTAQWELDAADPKLLKKLGQATIKLPGDLDLISARKESYAHPGALPSVHPATIQDDLARRDFTINTLAMRLDGEQAGQILNTFGGLADLQRGLLRVLQAQSFADDPTRIVRALRFVSRLDFQIEPETLAWMKAALPGLSGISADRVRHELDAVLGEPQQAAMLKRADELGVLAAIHPALVFDASMAASLARLPEKLPGQPWQLGGASACDLAYLLWLQQLPQADAKSVASQLNLATNLQSGLAALFPLRPVLPDLVGAPPSQVVAVLDQAPEMALYAAYLDAGDKAISELIFRYVTEWRAVQPSIDGHELRRRGLEPGPAYSRILAALRTAWLDGRVGSAEEEAALLDELMAEHG